MLQLHNVLLCMTTTLKTLTNKTNMELESILSSIKKYSFHYCMVYFVNKLELSYQIYQTNGNVRDENYNGKSLFPINDFFVM